MFEAEARIATLEASRYLTEIARSWMHTYPVRYDALTGEIEFPGVELVMTADGDSLTLRLTSSEKHQFGAAKDAIARRVDEVAGLSAGVRCVWHELT